MWVLDDGRRDWLRDFCAEKGARWVIRGNNSHGKAGNANAWLRRADGGTAPFVRVLGADFIPQRNMRPAQAGTKGHERRAQGLDGAQAPARPLADEFVQPLGRQAGGKGLVQIG